MHLKAFGCGRFLVVAAVIFIGLVAILIGLGFDERAYDDHALLPASSRTVALAPHKNAFYFYQQAQGKIQVLGDNTRQRLKDTVEGKIPWDAQFAAQLLKQNQPALILFEQGQRLQDFQLPKTKARQGDGKTHYPMSFYKLQILIDLKRLQIGVLKREGKVQQALQEIFGLLKMARHFRQPDLLAFAFSSSLHKKTLDDLVTIVQPSKLPPAALPGTISRLEAYRLTPNPLVEGLKFDYQQLTNAVLEAAMEGSGNGNFEDSGIFYYFLPNQTKRIAAQYYEQLISNVEAPFWEPNQATIQPVEWWNALMPNLLGRKILDVIVPRYGYITRYGLHLPNTQLSLIQIWIALKCYKAEHGQWPTTLSALTPRYLPAVPIDTLTGQFFQYDLQAGTIYSADKQAHESQLLMRFKAEH